MDFEKVEKMRGNDGVSFKKQVPTDERKSASFAADTKMRNTPASIYSQQQASLSSCSFNPQSPPL